MLTSRQNTFGSKCELSPALLEKVGKAGVMDNILSFAESKNQRELKKGDGAKRSRLTGEGRAGIGAGAGMGEGVQVSRSRHSAQAGRSREGQVMRQCIWYCKWASSAQCDTAVSCSGFSHRGQSVKLPACRLLASTQASPS